MRKSLALVAIVAVGLALAACGETPKHVAASHSASPTPSATPSPTPAPKAAAPARTSPLVPLVDSNVLGYCPAVAAVHFDGKADKVSQVDICSSEPSATGTTESASYVNFGLPALLSAYSQPNAMTTGAPCAKTEIDPLIVWITGKDGKVYSVYAPVDECGLPTAAAANAYQSAGLQVLYLTELDANGKPRATQVTN